MKKLLIGLLGMSLAAGALAHDEDKVAQMPPEGPYVQVSEVFDKLRHEPDGAVCYKVA